MRICVINPNSDRNTEARLREVVRRLNLPDEIVCVSMEGSPPLIVSREDILVAGAQMRTYVREHEKEFDAFIVACHADPCLDVIKEITDRIVVGQAECSVRIAMMAAPSYSVIVPSKKSYFTKRKLCRLYGAEQALASVRAAEGDDEYDAVLLAARKAVEEDGAAAIVLGCANYAGMDGKLEKALGVPVIDGVAAAILHAKAMDRYCRYKQAQ